MVCDEHTYVIASPHDVRRLERALHGLVGLPLAMAIPSYDEERLGFGKLWALRVAWREGHRLSADWIVATRGTRVLMNGRSAALKRVKGLIGLHVKSVGVGYPVLSLLLSFEGGQRVEIRPGPSDAESGVAYWVVRTPRRIEITTGPGPTWRRAKVPLSISDKWRARHRLRPQELPVAKVKSRVSRRKGKGLRRKGVVGP